MEAPEPQHPKGRCEPRLVFTRPSARQTGNHGDEDKAERDAQTELTGQLRWTGVIRPLM